MLANVQQTTIQPIIEATVAKGALIHTDEYGIYARLPAWGYRTKRSATGAANTPATRTGMASARCTSTPWRGSGPCCAPGCARTGASRRRSCRSISASSSSCTTHAVAAKPCSARSSPPWSHEPDPTPRKPTRANRLRCSRGASSCNWNPEPSASLRQSEGRLDLAEPGRSRREWEGYAASATGAGAASIDQREAQAGPGGFSIDQQRQCRGTTAPARPATAEAAAG